MHLGRYKENFELDEEDYDLLEDANVTGIRRPANLVRWRPWYLHQGGVWLPTSCHLGSS
jgi:hypothetical protein